MTEPMLTTRHGPRLSADHAVGALAWAVAFAVAGVFVWIVADLLMRGVGGLTWGFLTEAPSDAGRAGGIAPMLVSTALIIAVCLAVSLPLGLSAAVLLAETAGGDSAFGRLVRAALDVLAAVPSIVFALFGNALFCVYLGMGFSILSGGLTLACMVLPLMIRTAEQSLRAVPDDYRHAGAALGLSKAALLWRVLLPVATPGIVVGLVLSISRALAETAALLFTSGYVDRMPGSLMDSGRSLSIHIYDLAMNVPGGEGPANSTALVLLGLLIAINIGTHALAGRWVRTRIQP